MSAVADLRRCRVTGKRIHRSKTAVRKASRGPRRSVRVEECAHCVAMFTGAPDGIGPGYHVTRAASGG